MIFDSCLGIDFRQNHLILTFLRRSFGRIRLVDYGIHPILSENQKEERQAQVVSLINTFISRHQIGRERISISIPREKVVVRFIRLPIATKENLRKVLEYEMPKYTPFEKGEACFDYHILKEEKEWLNLFAVFAKRVDVDQYLSSLKKIGIQPISIQVPFTAALNLFFYNEGAKEKEVSVLLDVSHSFFEMNLIQAGDLKETLHLPLPSEGKELRMMSTLQRSGLKGDSLSKAEVFVYGLGSDDRMLASLKEIDQIKGVSFPPLNRMEAGKPTSELQKIYSSIGIPLKGLAKTHLDLNLLPFEMRKKVRQIGKPLLIILASIALLLTLTWGIGVSMWYRKELNAITAEIKKRRPEVEAVERLQKQKEDLGKEISTLARIKMEEVSKIAILHELTQLLPSTVWIWNFKYTGKEIEISGFADSATDLIPLLDKSPFFERVELSGPITKERMMRGSEVKEKERFKIKARLENRRTGS
ncbi:MAG: PilN domain-containing protein [Thermodesulfobacteriota bacterium]